MASIANIQAHDVSPILQQQAQDAALFMRDQATKAELQAKREQMAAQWQKDMLKYRSDVQEKIDRAVTNPNMPKVVIDWYISNTLPKVKKMLDEGNFLGADQEASSGIATATQYGNIIKEKQQNNKILSSQLAQHGVLPDAFEAELNKRMLFDQNTGNPRPIDDIINDKEDYSHDILFNGRNPNIFAPMTDLGLGKGTKEFEVDIKKDKGYSDEREKIKGKMPWYMTFDSITKTFDVDKGAIDLLYQQTVEGNDAKRARYSRAARAEGLSGATEIENRMKELFIADVKKQAVTDYQYIKQDNISDRAAMYMAGMISKVGSSSNKYTSPNAVDVIVGALATHGNYLQDTPILEGIKGYNSPVIDITSRMPKSGLIIGRKDKQPIIADQILVDPDNQAVIVKVKGEKNPVVHKGQAMVELVKQIPGFNAIKGGDEAFDRAFDMKGSLKVDRDVDGESYFRDMVQVDKSQKYQSALKAISNFNTERPAATVDVIKGRDIVVRKDGQQQRFKITGIVVDKKMFGGQKFGIKVEGRDTPILFNATDEQGFIEQLKKAIR